MQSRPRDNHTSGNRETRARQNRQALPVARRLCFGAERLEVIADDPMEHLLLRLTRMVDRRVRRHARTERTRRAGALARDGSMSYGIGRLARGNSCDVGRSPMWQFLQHVQRQDGRRDPLAPPVLALTFTLKPAPGPGTRDTRRAAEVQQAAFSEYERSGQPDTVVRLFSSRRGAGVSPTGG